MRNGMNQKPGAAAPATMQGGAGGAPANAGPSPQRVAVKPNLPAVPVEPGPPAGPPKHYRVMNGGTVVFGGNRTVMRAGKEVSDKDYDIRFLLRQGIRLEPIGQDGLTQHDPVQAPHKLGDVLIPNSPEGNAAREEFAKMVDDKGQPLPVPSPQFAAPAPPAK